MPRTGPAFVVSVSWPKAPTVNNKPTAMMVLTLPVSTTLHVIEGFNTGRRSPSKSRSKHRPRGNLQLTTRCSRIRDGPKWGSFTKRFGVSRFVWFSALNASPQIWRARCSFEAKFRTRAIFTVCIPGGRRCCVRRFRTCRPEALRTRQD